MKKIILRIAIALGAVGVLLTAIFYLCPGAVLAAAKQAARWNAGVTSKEVVVDEFTWPYLEGGSGDTVLLVHGFGADRDLWGELLPAIAKKYHVVAPDLPGFGDNSRIEGADYGISAQAVRVHAFVEKLGLKKFHVVGHSMGGGISAYYASLHPERIMGLVLICSFGLHTPVVSEGEKLLKKGERFLVFKNTDQYDRTMGMVFLYPQKLPGHLKSYIAGIGAANYEFHGKIFDTLGAGGFDILRGRLPRIQAKTLVLWGEEDRVFDVSCAEEYRKGIKDCRVVIVPDSGHMVFMDKPAESIAAVMGFLGGN